MRPDKTTTKTTTCMVFDESAKFKRVSLNDVNYRGPKLKCDIFDVLLRFRKFGVHLYESRTVWTQHLVKMSA